MHRLRIDFVSDVVCPWCVIGLKSLETALRNLGDVAPEIHFQPFELNPAMPPEGENVGEHVARKYGASPERSAANRSAIRDAAAEFGFVMKGGPDSRIWNSFDAHRLLHWAEGQGRQADLKLALFEAYFSRGENISDADLLVATAASVGLDGAAARDVLTSGAYAAEVRADEAYWQEQGITAVPAIIFDRQFAVLGGQPVEAFERVIRKIIAKRVAG
ncbi:disulfide bond formation protein DsbA [alpha proteobacterium AAP81b]|nr:disulfide bond formation protein DsbA [alpha proteobacterium AAP81b]